MAEKRECDTTPPPGSYPTHSCRYCTATCHSSQKIVFAFADLDDSLYEMKRAMNKMTKDLRQILSNHECYDMQMAEDLYRFKNVAKQDYMSFLQKRSTPSAGLDHFKDRI